MTKEPTKTITIAPPKNIRDQHVINQLPADLREQLGKLKETGYDLRYSKRDLFFTNGHVIYWPYKTKVEIYLSQQ